MKSYGNKNSTPLAREFQDLLKPHFKNGDFDITLTFNPHYWVPILNSKPDAISCSKHVYHYLNVINRGFYGRQYRSGKMRLKSANFFELNQSKGFHVHMVVENPIEYCRIEPQYRMKFLHTTWMDMNCSKEPRANFVDVTFDIDGWINYITKDINHSTLEMADITNWYLERPNSKK